MNKKLVANSLSNTVEGDGNRLERGKTFSNGFVQEK